MSRLRLLHLVFAASATVGCGPRALPAPSKDPAESRSFERTAAEPIAFFEDLPDEHSISSGTLPAGTRFQVVESSGRYVRVEWDGGRGWILADEIRRPEPTGFPTDPKRVQKIPTH